MASNQAIFASEVIDKSAVLGASDERPTDLAVADGDNVAVISDRAVRLAGENCYRSDGLAVQAVISDS